jgi:hypothetical protein
MEEKYALGPLKVWASDSRYTQNCGERERE